MFVGFASALNAQTYCTPGYLSACAFGDDINDVFIGTFQDTNTGCTTSGYYVATSDTIYIGQSTPTSVELTSNYTPQYFAIWADFNNDGDFSDANEHMWSSTTGTWAGNVGSIVIPSSVAQGSYRLRIRSNYSAALTAAQSCDTTLAYGEAHDYTLTVTPPPACPAPVFAGLLANDTSATLSWSSSDTSFIVEYGASGFANGLGTSVNVGDTFVTVNGLSANTLYDFYIKTDCTADTNGYSLNMGPYRVKTLCTAVSTPLYEGFENDSTGGFSNPNAPSCWFYEENLGAGGYGYITSGGFGISAYQGSQYYYLYNSFDSAVEALISPAIVGLDSGTKQMEFYAASTGFFSGNDIIIGTVSSPTDLSNLNVMDTLSVPNGGNWTQFTIYLDSTQGYNMSDQHIAIVSTTTNTFTAVYIDEVTISDAPQCLPPTAISATTVLVDSAQISYSTTGIATWLEYGPVGFVPGFQQSTGTLVSATGSPYWLTGLDTNTSYDVYVHQMCADSSVSPAFGPATFKTLQCPTALMCTFDLELTDSFGDGWNGAEVQVLNAAGGVEYTLGSSFITGSTYTETIMVCSGETFTVVVSDEGGYAYEIGLNVISNGSTISSYSPSTATVLGTQMASFTASCNTACPTPSNLTYLAGKNDATFSFDQNGGTGTYVYEWGPVGFTQATGAGVPSSIDSTTSNAFTISGLSSGSCYDVFIIANCGANGVSDTLGPVTFCTNLCDTTDLCTYTMSMYDTYGDGWNGAEVSVYYNGFLGQSFTFLTGDSSIVDFQVCSGTQIEVVNTQAGSYPSEVYYTLTDAAGTQSVSVSAGSFAVGTVDTLVANCVPVSCPMPSALAVTNLTATTADLSWTGGTGTFMYEYTAQGAMTSQMGSSTATTSTLSGLQSSTTYDLFLWEVCAPGDTSMKTYTTFTTDSCAAIALGNPSYNLDSVTVSDATFTFDWSGATGFTSFDISFGDGNSSTGASGTVSHAYGSNGNYTVTLTLYGDCDTATTSFTVSVNSIGFDEYGIGTLIMYPNPSSGLVTMDAVIEGQSEVRVRILNYLGQEILVDQWQPASDQFNKTYDLSNEAAGMYLFEVSTDKGIIQKPVVIKH